jgi:hypothetical protein
MEDLVAAQSDERERKEQELLTEMEAAGEVYLAAAAEFARIGKDCRRTLGFPGGAAVLRDAATNERIAFDRYNKALEALTRFILQDRPQVLPKDSP